MGATIERETWIICNLCNRRVVIEAAASRSAPVTCDYCGKHLGSVAEAREQCMQRDEGSEQE
jgi:hypothetical protein